MCAENFQIECIKRCDCIDASCILGKLVAQTREASREEPSVRCSRSRLHSETITARDVIMDFVSNGGTILRARALTLQIAGTNKTGSHFSICRWHEMVVLYARVYVVCVFFSSFYAISIHHQSHNHISGVGCCCCCCCCIR